MNNCGEEKELDKLRKTIEEFRAKAERCGNGFEEVKTSITQTEISCNDSGVWSSPPAYPAPPLPANRHFPHLDALSPNSSVNKRISSGSISSMSSHASHSSVSSASSSGSSAENDQRHKKKRWLPLKSFTKGSRPPQSCSQSEFADRDDTGCLLSPSSTARSFLNTGFDMPLDHASYSEVLQVIQEKDRKLTDAKLEALTTQHQLHQLQDQINQMQHEMQLLRLENEKLQANNPNYDDQTSSARIKSSVLSSLRSNVDQMSTSNLSQANPALASFDSFRLYRLVSPGSEEDGMQIQFKVVSPAAISLPSQHRPPAKITIGSVPVSRKASWEDLDKKTSDLFLEYCKCVDGDHKLGLTSSSISFYKVGEQTRVPGSKPPELLPCAFIIGSVDSVEITLKDASCGTVDLMSFKSLIPKTILQQYIKAFLQNKRLMLYGPSGTGKTALAHSFANHLIARERNINKENSVFVYDVKQKGEEDLQTNIAAFSKICDATPRNSSLPYVIIVENCFMLNSITEVFMPLIEQSRTQHCPYIIGTMLQSKVEIITEAKDFDWISCSSSSVHVKEYLTRFLRRSMVETAILGSLTNEDDFQNMLRVITWLPLCWYQVNRCLESNSAGDVTIGPRVFTSCPTDFYSSCSWFVQVWNYVIAPYIIAAIRKVRQSQLEEKSSTTRKWIDPTIWVIESFPWNPSDMGCDNTLRLKKINSEEFNCPVVASKIEQAQSKETPSHGRTSSYASKTLTELDSNRSKKVDLSSNVTRKFHTEGRKDQQLNRTVPSMELMGLQDSKNTSIVWHRQNDLMSSPAKSMLHTCINNN